MSYLANLSSDIKRRTAHDFEKASAVRARRGGGGGGGVSGNPLAQALTAGGQASGGEVSQSAEQYRHFIGWAYVAISAIARRVAGQPIKMGRKKAAVKTASGKRPPKSLKAFEISKLPEWAKAAATGNTNIEIVEDNPLLMTLENPNDIMVTWTLLYSVIASLEVTGKCYLWISDAPRGKPGQSGEAPPYQIWPLPTHWVKAKHENGVFNSTYKVTPPSAGGSGFDVPGGQVVEVVLPDPANPMGHISPMQTQSKAITTDESIQTAQQKAMENGIFPGVMLIAGRLPDSPTGQPGMRPILTAEQRSQLIGAVSALYQGVQNYNEPFIVDGLLENVVPYTNAPAEMDFLNSGQQVKSRIMQAYGVNPIVVGEIQAGNRAQAAVAEENFCNNCINPLLSLISQVLTIWLRRTDLPGLESDNDTLIWIEACRASDADLKLAEWSFAQTAGAVSVDEIRTHLLGLEPRGSDELPPSAQEIQQQQMQMQHEVNLERSRAQGARDGQQQGGGKQPPQFGGKKPPPKIAGGKKPPKKLKPPKKPAPEEADDTEEEKQWRAACRKMVTTDGRIELWVKAANSGEKKLQASVMKLFRSAWEDVAAQYAKLVVKRPGIFSNEENAAEIAEIIFDSGHWGKSFDVLASDMVSLASFGAASELATFKVHKNSFAVVKGREKPTGKELDVHLPSDVLKGIKDEVKSSFKQPYWNNIHKTTRKELESAIRTGISEGDSNPQLAKRIRDVFIGDIGKKRSEMIARTEATGALNSGHHEAQKSISDDPLFIGRRWVTVGDDDVRDTHDEMSMVVAEKMSDFEIPSKDAGVEYAPYPGYYGLSAENRIGCRCTAIGEFRSLG